MQHHTPYETKHSKYSEVNGQMRKDRVQQLKTGLEKQSSFFQKHSSESESNTVASYEVAKLIAENMKPLVDGEFVKKVLNDRRRYCMPIKRKVIRQYQSFCQNRDKKNRRHVGGCETSSNG